MQFNVILQDIKELHQVEIRETSETPKLRFSFRVILRFGRFAYTRYDPDVFKVRGSVFKTDKVGQGEERLKRVSFRSDVFAE